MCLIDSPSMPAVETPAKPQEAKQPDTPKMMADARTARKGAGGMAGGSTLLTGTSGSTPATGQLGKTSLLGQ